MSYEILRKPRVLALIGMGQTWLYEHVKAGKFPAPIKLGERAVGWRRSDVEAWLASRERAQ
ncbi:AlpA family phage regulatory protein [Hyphomonadaceae bacterium BL14]|nr:AlpA family phage regulatory protein [Hyphomonadaceae bacterium BL14]